MKNIAILFGGESSEYAVSLESVTSVLQHINKHQYNIYPIGISQTGKWYLYKGQLEHITNDTWLSDTENLQEAFLVPNGSSSLYIFKNAKLINRIHMDACLPILHGQHSEDGTIAALLDLAHIKNCSTNLFSAVTCMDKILSHTLAKQNGIPCANFIVLEENKKIDKEILEKITFPCIVKPNQCGSSFGISKVNNQEELIVAIDEAFRYDTRILIEDFIEGHEVGCAILETNPLTIGELDYINAHNGFFDFDQKYHGELEQIITPAPLSEELTQQIKEIAVKLYQLHGCTNFARIDLFVTEQEEIYFNEINTIPGFTSHSRYPKMMKSIGISFDELIEKMLTLGE